jgi:hypothetical protein
MERGDVEVDGTVLMSENQSDCHKSVRQRFRVLSNYGIGPGLSGPTMPARVRERGGGFHHTLSRDKGRDWNGQPGYIIGPSWVSHFPARRSCTVQGLQ